MTLRDSLRNLLDEEVRDGVAAQLVKEASSDYIPQPEGYESLFSLGDYVIGVALGEVSSFPIDNQQFFQAAQKIIERYVGTLVEIGEKRTVG